MKPPERITTEITNAGTRSIAIAVGFTNDNWKYLEVMFKGNQTGNKYSERFQCLDYLTGNSKFIKTQTLELSQCQLNSALTTFAAVLYIKLIPN